MGAQLRRNTQAYSQLLFGREREGGASLREAASLATPVIVSFISSGGGPGEALLVKKRPPPEFAFVYERWFVVEKVDLRFFGGDDDLRGRGGGRG